MSNTTSILNPAEFIPKRGGEKAASKPRLWLKTAGIIAALLGFVVAVSYFGLMRQSLRLDEAQSLWQSSHSPSMVLRIIAADVHVPLYGTLLHFWQMLFGNSVAAARLMSLIFYLITIPLVYAVGRKTLGRRAALFATVLIATSPFLNWYGNETRMYSLLTLTTVINQLFFIKIIKDREAGANEVAWIGYGLSALLGMYSHYFFAFVLITQAIFYFLKKQLFPRQALRNFIIVAGILILAFVPWAWFVKSLGFAANTQPHLGKPTTVDLFNTFSQFLFGFQDDHLNTLLVSLWPLTVILGFLALRKNKNHSPMVLYFFLSATLPVIAAFVFSIFIKPFYLSRYLILAAPSLYLLIAWLISAYPRRLRLSLQTALISIMLVTLGIQTMSAQAPVKENYKQVSEYLSGNVSAHDIIVISAPFTVYPIQYYYRGPAAITTLPIWDQYLAGAIPNFSDQELPKQVDKLKADHELMYVVLSYDQGYERNIKYYFDTHFQKVEEKNFSKGLNVYTYRSGSYSASFSEIMKASANPATSTTPVLRQ